MVKVLEVNGYIVKVKFDWKKDYAVITIEQNAIVYQKYCGTCMFKDIDAKILELINEEEKKRTIENWLSIFAV